jgi:hypothetical protein
MYRSLVVIETSFASAMQLVAKRIYGRPKVDELETDDYVGLANNSAGTLTLVERVTRREVHATALVDDGSLQAFGKLDEQTHPVGRASIAIRNDHGFSASTSSLAVSSTAPESPCGGTGTVSFGIANGAFFAIGSSCR